MRPKGKPEELERRRRRALALLQDGHGVRQTARIVGVTPGAVTQWRQAYESGGEAALVAKPVPGRPSKLSAAQRKTLAHLLLQGPGQHGYATALWTLPRIVEVIRKRFGVTYDPSGVWHMLRSMGWSCQKPERRARERNEQAIETWRKRDWPRIKKSANKPS